MGAPLGGIGDAMFWLTLLPICGGIAADLALQGSILGAIFFIVAFNTVHFGLQFGLAHYAYRKGVSAIPLIKANTKKSRPCGFHGRNDSHWRFGRNLCSSLYNCRN